MSLVLAGVDEAGLGPILGPYCGALAAFDSPEPANLFNRLHPVIQQKRQKDSLALCDSKQLYSPLLGIAELEKTVLSFYCLLFPFPDTLETFLKTLSAEQHRDYTQAPWLKNLSGMSLPMANEREEILQWTEKLRNKLAETDLSLKCLRLQMIPAYRFNELLKKWQNKAVVCQQILNPLMEEIFQEEQLSLKVDRQGGRRFYGDWLLQLAPGAPLVAQKELREESLYQMGKRNISFQVQADSHYLETALASLFAKYSREGVMLAFNAYWSRMSPELKTTAGYYKDGKRFLKDIAGLEIAPEVRGSMARMK